MNNIPCRSCGGHVNAALNICPICKGRVHLCNSCQIAYAEVKNTKLGWVCKNCLQGIQPLLDDQMRCPVCGYVQNKNEEECSDCGVNFKKLKIDCPACNEKIQFGVDKCSNCGVNLNKVQKKQSSTTMLNKSARNDNSKRCPHCGSSNLYKISITNKVGAGVLFGFFSIGHIAKTFKCYDCGYKW